MPWVHITDWHKYPALWLLDRDTEQPGNTFAVSDSELKILQKHDVPFHIYGKSDACHNGHYSICVFEKQCTCMCHWHPNESTWQDEYEIVFS